MHKGVFNISREDEKIKCIKTANRDFNTTDGITCDKNINK